ncbi:hypothetical protein RISK_001593 [Rhodopirellula islandica]|uniref:Uncharacterized protein n=1 Tax=Rhodopirellula islandica TaxID=595434 RepID=A0A0J1BIM6_RHOIS|nr:hypothetical protein RISK_001593 [Rhodopirellula islandica]
MNGINGGETGCLQIKDHPERRCLLQAVEPSVIRIVTVYQNPPCSQRWLTDEWRSLTFD